MQIPNQQNRPFTGANMTPMIDVVFLLIIFFLVSSHLARQESRLPVELPVAQSHNERDVDPVSLTITLNESGRLLAGGSEVSESELPAVLSAVQQKENGSASLRIRSDGRLKYKRVEPVLRAAAKAGILDVKLAVKEAS